MTRGDPTSLLTRWSAPRLRSVLSAVPDAILILRLSGAVVPGNRAARGLLAPRRRAAQPPVIQEILPDFDAADPPRESREMQALRPDGSRIAGLYAAGNAMANPIGSKAVGAGTTLGPCLTWGYICGQSLLHENAP